MLSFTDDISRKSVGYLLKTKNQTLKVFLSNLRHLLKTRHVSKLRDLEPIVEESSVTLFMIFWPKVALLMRPLPFSPQQNRMAEILNCTVTEKDRCVLQGAGLGRCYWGEAVKGSIPEEVWCCS